MRILSWNLWWKFGPWEERQPAITAELALVEPDIAFLQEVWSDAEADQAVDLAKPAGLHVARSIKADGTPYRFGNAVLSRWPILESRTLVLPASDGSPSHRSAVLTLVDAPLGPQVFATTHLDWHYDKSATRQRQLEFLIPELGRWHQERAPELACVLGGDFNAVPEADEIRRLTGLAPGYGGRDRASNHGNDGDNDGHLIFTDGWAATTDDPGYTWTRENPHSADAQWPRRRLDYVFVSWPRPKPTTNPLQARLAGREAHDGVVPSDHYAVVVECDDRPPLEEDGF